MKLLEDGNDRRFIKNKCTWLLWTIDLIPGNCHYKAYGTIEQTRLCMAF